MRSGTVLIEENRVDDSIHPLRSSRVNLHVAVNVIDCVNAAAKRRECLRVEHYSRRSVNNGNRFGTAILIPLAQIKRDFMSLAVREIHVEGKGVVVDSEIGGGNPGGRSAGGL